MDFRRVLVVVLCSIAFVGSTSAIAQEASPEPVPVADEGPITLLLVERAANRTTLDLGESGSSVGDLLVWGPNALYDEANEVDTGATTQGVCVWFNAVGDCLLNETNVFPDGSTIEIQGIQPGASTTSTRTIVGGSGLYLGASGTVTITPSEDFTIWSRTYEIWF